MMAGARRVTLSDVATASGVSRATVSFVLNDDPNRTKPGAARLAGGVRRERRPADSTSRRPRPHPPRDGVARPDVDYVARR
ncbi:LacI family DNA-binding transcriptional regulator [Streptomyces mirabilis]|uniref:LacI family DNA-binding transcriptional regulator n=1 Tax=Streptomyces mirabilis TaxID=68239 RepID=UPI0036E23675